MAFFRGALWSILADGVEKVGSLVGIALFA
jgi:hypothetical protein